MRPAIKYLVLLGGIAGIPQLSAASDIVDVVAAQSATRDLVLEMTKPQTCALTFGEDFGFDAFFGGVQDGVLERLTNGVEPSETYRLRLYSAVQNGLDEMMEDGSIVFDGETQTMTMVACS